MKKNIIPIIIGSVFILMFAIILYRVFSQNADANHDVFVQERVRFLLAGNAMIDIESIEVYETEDSVYCMIEYKITLDQETNDSFMITEKNSNFVVYHGFEQNFPAFMAAYENARTSHIAKIVYTAQQITSFVDNA
ncbi:MAG: hypothetical protein IH571_02745 [Acholeplasmataceae bacterium]|nr:hypothetical protein [Acholeplasmataceae bacterium]